jgi:hypothetical protein
MRNRGCLRTPDPSFGRCQCCWFQPCYYCGFRRRGRPMRSSQVVWIRLSRIHLNYPHPCSNSSLATFCLPPEQERKESNSKDPKRHTNTSTQSRADAGCLNTIVRKGALICIVCSLPRATAVGHLCEQQIHSSFESFPSGPIFECCNSAAISARAIATIIGGWCTRSIARTERCVCGIGRVVRRISRYH